MKRNQKHPFQDSPMAFVESLTIPGAHGPARFGEVMADFQRSTFSALLPSIEAVATGQKPPIGKFWVERCKGSSKDSDITCAILWLLLFSPRLLFGQSAAGDKEQASELLKCAKALLKLNEWLNNSIEIQNWQILNRHTKSCVEVISSDALGSHGSRPHIVFLNELVHHRNPDFSSTVLDNCTKVPRGVVIVATNSGFLGSWQHQWREHARTSSLWNFQKHDKPAPWLSDGEIREAKHRNSRNRYLRLWQGEWVSESGDGIAEDELQDSIKSSLQRLDKPEPGFRYYGGLDIGIRRDATGFVIIGRNSATGEFRLAQCHFFPASKKRDVQLQQVEDRMMQAHKTFNLSEILIDPSQGMNTFQRFKQAGIPVRLQSSGEAGKNELAQCLLNAFANRMVSLFEHELLIKQLQQMSLKEKANGRMTLIHPRTKDGHGDLAEAFCHALLSAAENKRSFNVVHQWCGPGNNFDPCRSDFYGQIAPKRWVLPDPQQQPTYGGVGAPVPRWAARFN